MNQCAQNSASTARKFLATLVQNSEITNSPNTCVSNRSHSCSAQPWPQPLFATISSWCRTSGEHCLPHSLLDSMFIFSLRFGLLCWFILAFCWLVGGDPGHRPPHSSWASSSNQTITSLHSACWRAVAAFQLRSPPWNLLNFGILHWASAPGISTQW